MKPRWGRTDEDGNQPLGAGDAGFRLSVLRCSVARSVCRLAATLSLIVVRRRMLLTSETLKEIDAQVRGGFENRERIIEIFSEEMYAPGELDPAEIAAAVDEAISRHELEKRSWPEVTDCDKLDAVFEAISKRGIIGLQNAGYTQSDGYDDCREAHRCAPEPAKILGYCFYHGQDLESAVAGGGLYLAFGPVNPKEEQTTGPQVGRIIVEEAERVGFHVTWDGSFGHRILIAPFDWKKR